MPTMARILAAMVCIWLATQSRAEPPPLTVFAAASLKTALDQANEAFAAVSKIKVRTSYAASSALARQIEQGAPADVFASADVDWMDYLDARKKIAAGTRVDLLGNRLVIIAAKDSPVAKLELEEAAFENALGSGRLALAEVNSVPAGRYAKAALQHLRLWDGLAARLAMAENVRAALIFVSRGEAPLGIVYATDAAADTGVKIVATFPPESHPAIIYPFAVTEGANAGRAQQYLEFLRNPSARTIFEKQGFSVIAGGS